eukprot:Blabericola_migrator_1__4872@NODE_254_length_10809_cov_136_023925_g213_i0_p5_GENE_NODE_254_length_10809_cov_136_023925_g213_i0NODE_254_length_10809_cov_136_023925_g213_i0_p5_ORF_typecomplete_len311_score63_09Med10/PF09748_9/1e07_NODE_254_length_10809_cov_136_023925_g213_i045965528
MSNSALKRSTPEDDSLLPPEAKRSKGEGDLGITVPAETRLKAEAENVEERIEADVVEAKNELLTPDEVKKDEEVPFAPLAAPQRPATGDDPTSPAQEDDEDLDNNSEEAVVERVQLLLMDAVEELSIVSRTLERWTVFAPSVGVSEDQRRAEQSRYDEAVKKGKQRIIEHLRKAMRKFRRLSDCAKASQVFDNADLPVDLIAHVDAFLSPNTWLRALYDELDYQNCVARGELAALSSFHSTLKFYVNVLDNLSMSQTVKIPDFTEASLAPTAPRRPVRKSDGSVDLVHVLTLLKGPLTPSPIGSDLFIRK